MVTFRWRGPDDPDPHADKLIEHKP
jgi:hypothetical protein